MYGWMDGWMMMMMMMMTQKEGGDSVYNRKGFRYTHCIADPSFPSSWYYRPSETEPFQARFDFEDTSSHLLFDRAGTYVTTEKGFRMVRANVAVREGRSYWECRIVRGIRPRPSDDDGDHARTAATVSAKPPSQEPRGHVRMGWARREASLDAPVGFDAYSYGLRDVGGQKTHMSRPEDFFPPGEEIREGDVIGLQIDLPSLTVHRNLLKGKSERHHHQRQQQQNRSKTNKGKNRPRDVKEDDQQDETAARDEKEAPDVLRDKVPIRYKAHLYFEQFDYHPTKELEELFNPAPAFSAATTTSSAVSNTAAASAQASSLTTHVLPSRRTLPDSSIKIYKNGKYMGTAFTDLLAFLPPASRPLTHGTGHGREGLDDGMLGYFPAVSVFRGGAAQINLGPDFWFPPPGDTNNDDDDDDDDDDAANDCSTSSYPRPRLRPVSDRYEEQIAESVVYDVIDEVDFWLQDHSALDIIIPDTNHSSSFSSFPTSSANVHGGVITAPVAAVDSTADPTTSLVGLDQQPEEIKEVMQEDE